MSFVNEKIPDEDKLKLSAVITFEKLKALAPWVPKFSEPSRWTIDRERGVYLIFLTGGGREQLPYYVLSIDNQIVVFNAHRGGEGDNTIGLKEYWEVHDLRIPPALESRREEVKQLISEGLEEMAYFRPLADGGTFESPNTVVRGNILSFNVEFQ